MNKYNKVIISKDRNGKRYSLFEIYNGNILSSRTFVSKYELKMYLDISGKRISAYTTAHNICKNGIIFTKLGFYKAK